MFQLSAEDLPFIQAKVDSWPNNLLNQTLILNQAVIDSRQVSSGDLFVCLEGESTDGHNFVASATAAGAKALLIHTKHLKAVKSRIPQTLSIVILESTDVLFSLQQLAKLRRQRFKGEVIGVVGSNGKTSTKEMLSSLLKCHYGNEAVFATAGNLNNHIGLPLSVLSISDSNKYAVLEMGMNHIGEIDLLTQICRPNHAIVTSIGFEHMEFFESIDEVAIAELEVLNGMNGGRILYPASAPQQPYLTEIATQKQVSIQLFEIVNESQNQDFLLKQTTDQEQNQNPNPNPNSNPNSNPNLNSNPNQSIATGTYSDGWLFSEIQGQNFSLGEYFGEAMASNLLASITLILEQQYIPAEQLQACCKKLKPQIQGRLRIEMMGSTVVVDDSYNANPDSFRKSILALSEKLKNGRLLCLAGQMAELGHFSEIGHSQVGQYLKEAKFDTVLGCGKSDMKILLNSFSAEKPPFYFADSALLASYIKENPNIIKQFDGILIKGSRSAQMERVLPVLREILTE